MRKSQSNSKPADPALEAHVRVWNKPLAKWIKDEAAYNHRTTSAQFVHIAQEAMNNALRAVAPTVRPEV